MLMLSLNNKYFIGSVYAGMLWSLGDVTDVSGYVCNHGSLRVGNETLRPLGVAMGDVVSVTRV